MNRPKPWYRQVGPISWYRSDWFRLNLVWGDRLIASVTWKPLRFLSLDLGGKIHSRSLYGAPSSIEPRWSWSWQCRESKERLAAMVQAAKQAKGDARP